jgi:hypothetical protein
MHKPKTFALRISDADRRRAQRLARENGLSENRFYSDLIQEGLLMREQMSYFEKLRALRVQPSEGLALLDRAPDVRPAQEDRLPPASKQRTARRPRRSA